VANISVAHKPKDINVSIEGSTSTKITNLSVPTANTEVGHALNAGLKQILIRSRTLADLKMAFTVAESGTKYVTIKAGNVFFLDDISFTGKTVYLQSPTAGLTVEILETF
jgi:hypothetical protein